MTGRRFSKARSIANRLGICPGPSFGGPNAGKIVRHKISARLVLFDEAEVAAFIESSRASPRAREFPKSVVGRKGRSKDA